MTLAVIAACSLIIGTALQRRASGCDSQVEQSSRRLAGARNPEDVKAVYNQLKGQVTCGNEKTTKNDSRKKQLQDLQFYRNKAVSESLAGDTTAAQKDAAAGLAIAQKLGIHAGKATPEQYLVKELQYVKEGAY